MKKILSVLTLALATLAIKPAYASSLYDQSKMFYVPFSVGEYLPESSRDMNNSFYGALGLGYNFTNVIGLQTELGYFSPDYQTNGQPMNSYLWTVDARFNAANPTMVVPYLLIGVGALKLPSTNFVENVGVGVDFKLSPTFSFGGTAKEIIQNNGHTKYDSLLTGNVTWYFGGNKKVVQQPIQEPGPVILTQDQQSMLQKAQTTLKPILPAGVSLCKNNKLGNQAGCVTFDGDTMVMHLNVHFEQNKADIQSQYNTPISSVGNFMHAYADAQVTLYGYASAEGPAAFNQALSLQRAQSIKKYLVTQAKINKNRIATVGKGTADPIASNATLAGRQLNRRVEAQIPVPYDLDH